MNVCKKDLQMLMWLTDRISFETLILATQRSFHVENKLFFTGFDSLKCTFSIVLITEAHNFLNC